MALIEQEALIQAIEELKGNCDSRFYDEAIIDCVGEAVSAPTSNAAPVGHGRWIVHTKHFSPYQRCSVCGFEIPLVETETEQEICLYKHCPECTVRMDGGEGT